ncbi:MAG: hypothetical protein SFU98_17155 [Leptospiraceae bacterium]|nr:hypothetical protein [Leptospiraceae bacterium]
MSYFKLNIFLLILLILFQSFCFDVYTKEEKILSKRVVETKNKTEIKKVYLLISNIVKNELQLTLNGYLIEEKKRVQLIEEFIESEKDFRFSEFAKKGHGGNDAGAGILVLVIVLLEATTLPVRLKSDSEFRYKELIKKIDEKHLEKISPETVLIEFCEFKEDKKYSFNDGNLTIPISSLLIKTENLKSFCYNLIDKSNQEKLFTGSLDFSPFLENKDLVFEIYKNDNKK